MVTTRRQEQLQHSAVGLGQHQQQPEHAGQALEPLKETRATSPPRANPLPLTPDSPPGNTSRRRQQAAAAAAAKPKSALKVPRVIAEVADGELAGARHLDDYAEVTPLQANKKRVRIHSGNNIVHVFGASSCNSGDAVAGTEGSAEETPQSSRRFSFGSHLGSTSVHSPTLPHYQAFIKGVLGQQAQQEAQRQLQAGALDRMDGPAAATGDGAAGPQQSHRLLRRQNSSISRAQAFPWAAVASISIWMLVSSALIFVNKILMVDRGFCFPFALTALGQAASTLLGWLVGHSGLMKAQERPSLPLPKFVPVAFCSAATLFLGNYAYLGLSVAFINILKALTPAMTLGASMVLGVERPSRLVTASLGLIALGTAIATAQETGTSHFSWLSFGAFLLSMVFEALRVVLAERLLGTTQQRYSPMEVLVYIGPLITVLLAGGALITERRGLLEEGLGILAAHPLHFAAACLVSFLVNTFSFFAIQTTSSLTFKVAGCVKNCVVIWVGVLLGDELTLKEAMGFGLSMLGFLLYTFLRSSSASQGPRPKRA